MPRPHKSVAKKTSRKSSAGGAALSSRIKTLEKKVGQKNLAKILGVTPRSIRRYKQGTRKPQPPVLTRVKRAERYSTGMRKTKSVKTRKARIEKIIERHPESVYFETRKTFEFAETEHIDLLNVSMDDIEGLIGYLKEQGCDAAYFVIRGTDTKTLDERYASSEVMSLDDFAEAWEEELADILKQYNLHVDQIDLIGVKHYAPTPQT